jgi:hypothetical protein
LRKPNRDPQTELELHDERRRSAITVPCFQCGARIGELCTTADGHTAAQEHTSRIRQAQLRQEET